MMDVEIFYAALGGSVATMALMLAGLRFSGQTAQILVLSVLARWRQIRGVKALAPVVALIAMAAACFSNVLGRNALPVVASAKLEASAVAAFSEAPGAAAEQDVAAGGRQRAIASLRDYAEKVREKRQTIAAIGSEGDTSSKEDAGAPQSSRRRHHDSALGKTPCKRACKYRRLADARMVLRKYWKTQ